MNYHINSTEVKGYLKEIIDYKEGVKFHIPDERKGELTKLFIDAFVLDIDTLIREDADHGRVVIDGTRYAPKSGILDLGEFFIAVVNRVSYNLKETFKYTPIETASLLRAVALALLYSFKQLFEDQESGDFVCFGNRVGTAESTDFGLYLKAAFDTFSSFIEEW